MKKLEKTKVNPLDQIAKRIEKYVETYDSPVIHDPISNTFKTENQIKHEAGIKENNRVIDTLNKYEDTPDIPKQKVPKMNAVDMYKAYKKTASPAEKKEFEQIEERSKPAKERKVYKAKMAALDAQLKQSLLTPIPTNIVEPETKNDFLNDLATERKDPDLFRGLGAYLHKKI